MTAVGAAQPSTSAVAARRGAVFAAPEASQQSRLPLAAGERWYAVHTLAFCELRAQGQLEHQGFRTFLPRRLKTVRHARKLRTVEAAFFPRYLFVALDVERDGWRKVNGTYGVSRLVMRGDAPHPVPRGIVETLIASTDRAGVLRFSERLKVGGRVRLLAGPFAEQLGVLDALDDSSRVRVLLDLFAREVPIATEAENLPPIG